MAGSAAGLSVTDALVGGSAEQAIPGLRVVVVDVGDEVRAGDQRAAGIGGAVGELARSSACDPNTEAYADVPSALQVKPPYGAPESASSAVGGDVGRVRATRPGGQCQRGRHQAGGRRG
jgi:hypothetical protein